MRSTGTLSAAEAAEALGITRATLYAYVSRGLVRSEARDGSRARRYRAEDVAVLLQRREQRRDPGRAMADALHWGTPLLESSLTLIADGELFYRGVPVAELATTSSLEQVAALLWGDFPDEAPPAGSHGLLRLESELPPIEALQMVLVSASAHDLAGYDLSRQGVQKTGARIVRLLAAAAAKLKGSRRPVAEVLAESWAPGRAAAVPLLQAVLVLTADHELNVSAFTARCVASARATPYGAVTAALAALRGSLHGGSTEQVEALFDEAGRPERAAEVCRSRLRRGERLPGFGQPLYPEGDPRGALLMELLRQAAPNSRPLALADALSTTARELIDKGPNVDFAVAAVRRVLGAPDHAALALFAVARSVGWIAHVLEQYEEGRLIRPRARYTGPTPRP